MDTAAVKLIAVDAEADYEKSVQEKEAYIESRSVEQAKETARGEKVPHSTPVKKLSRICTTAGSIAWGIASEV